MMPSTIYKLSFLAALAAVFLVASPAHGAETLSCRLVEEVGVPRTLQQTPVLLQFTDSTSLTTDYPETVEPGTLVFYVSDPSGQLLSSEFTYCELTYHLPQEVELNWVRSLTREKRSPPSLGKSWYSLSAKSDKDEKSVSAVLGPRGDQKDHLAVSLAVYSTSALVNAVLGKPLSLSCGMWRGQQSRFAVEWRHRALGNGKVLYAYDGWQDKVEEELPGYRMNFSSLHKEGDVSLSLEKVDVKHQGTFLCTAYLPYVRAQRDIQLQVTAKPQISLLPARLFARPGEELTLSCEISHFHPLEISVDFLVQLPGESQSSLLPGTSLSPHGHNQDGTYSITAFQRITASHDLHGARYSCRVNHASAANGMSRIQTLQIAGVSGSSLEDYMYLFLTALFLYGFLSYVHRTAVSFFRTPKEANDRKSKPE
ncbi:tapasin [Mixophyes fleayi]|uniref:tapasin n=1 Tax=Mixophyes fleayi TaxID=3061075 RepID=UPI003F4D9057